ncbi:MAG: 1-(5-phosphoribosyl)-5-[(5-phosphoribosylamino)methylideneamino] imidazole-4-carboxamide isomerase [Deltaproteobacteria bacterium]|nr:1-(5-phosphoribosyl)-5-[(5-phosphoribosylamino)methylideneamino] imidazole-4-carboxamide isomerase [Deltaproteobacteria bacterium]
MSDFQLIPAIDLLGGRCVRLAQGRYDEVTRYGEDPAAVAARFAAAPGLRRLHVVDLDGARAGAPAPGNRAALRAILAALQSRNIALQLGGGLRSLASVEEWLELGVERAILGTAALRNPELVREAARRHPGRIGVGVDARGGRVAVQGWLESSDCSALDIARRFQDAGVAALIHTDIARDGMGSGPNLEASAALAAALSIPVIASGGVGSLDHVRAAARRPGIAGLIVGRALHDGAMELGSALEAAACC